MTVQSKEVYKSRLLLLADFLSNLDEDRFDYNNWVGDDWGGKQDLSCGTQACAMGWSATIPELREAGLCLVTKNNKGHVSLVENDCDEYTAAEKVFGVSSDEFRYLFMPTACVDLSHLDPNMNLEFGLPTNSTPMEVADHIRNFVKLKY